MIIIIGVIVGCYCLVSLFIGLLDLLCLIRQDQHFRDVPQGDIGEYEFKSQILGIHNWIFLPSWLVIAPFLNW